MPTPEEKERVVGQQDSVKDSVDVIIEEFLILLQDVTFIHDDVSKLD